MLGRMSGDDRRVTDPLLALGVESEVQVSLEHYIEGPLRQIEAARKALHSPSLNARKSRPNFERVGSHAGDSSSRSPFVIDAYNMSQKPSRKCLSRAQMAEPYELSQDLLDKQQEVLSNRYGGQTVANQAANTIQRAYRRYSMGKKFAAITSAASNKSENRLSRRFASLSQQLMLNNSADGVVIVQQQQYHHHHSHQHKLGGGGEPQQTSQRLTSHQHYHHHPQMQQQFHHADRTRPPDCGVLTENFHQGCCVYSGVNSKASYAGLAQVGSHSSTSSSSSSSSHSVAEASRQQQQLLCHAASCPDPQQLEWVNKLRTAHSHDEDEVGGDDEEEDQSDAEMQSFPLDYLPERGLLPPAAGGGAGRLALFPPAAAATNQRHISTGRLGGPSHAHCANCGSGQALPAHHSHHHHHHHQQHYHGRRAAPDVPKRTVSRLTSLDVGESSELYPARSSSSSGEPQQQLLLQLSGRHGGGGEQQSSRAGSNQSSPRIGFTEQQQQQLLIAAAAAAHAKLEPKLSSSSSHHHHHHQQHLQQQPPPSCTSSSQLRPNRDLNRNNVRSPPGSSTTITTTTTSQVDSGSTSASGGRIKDFYHPNYAVNEVIRKRHYRTGLNIFNKKPEKGIAYLIAKGFLDNSAPAVARFLITRKGLSKQMIGEYLGNISQPFNQAVLTSFANEMDLSGMQVDVALRKFQTYFRMPGEAQKIERLMEVFSQRYCYCNSNVVSKLNSTDTIFILAFAIILLNTDLHTPNLKPEKRMKAEDFIRNLRGIDEGADVDRESLLGIYERIRVSEFKPGSDHVTQVMKVQQTIVAKCPNLAVPYRRLVCYCRLYEVQDRNKKDRPGQHQREVFLFNDILVITKIHSRRKNSVTYTFRNSFPLTGMLVSLFENNFYSHGIVLTQRWDRKVVITLNARNDHDRSKFVEDLRESIAEMDEMEQLRIEAELEKQQHATNTTIRDPAINDIQDTQQRLRYGNGVNGGLAGDQAVLKRTAINNSLLDLVEAGGGSSSHHGYHHAGQDRPLRRGSVGSLDSGMSVSFQSGSAGSAGTVSQESSPQQQQLLAMRAAGGGQARPRKLSATNISTNL